MKTPIGNRNPYNIPRVVFSSFYPTILFLKGSQWECSYTAILCYPCHRTLYYVENVTFGRKFSFDNINLCESNVVQIYELIFCDS